MRYHHVCKNEKAVYPHGGQEKMGLKARDPFFREQIDMTPAVVSFFDGKDHHRSGDLQW